MFHVVARIWQGVPVTRADASLSHPQAGLGIIPLFHTHTGYTLMLIIPRSKNQAVVIGGDIIVNVVEVDGDRVELSIEYPDGTSVRAEKEVVEREFAVEEPVAAT